MNLRTIFNSVLSLKDKVILDEKIDPLFNASCGYFFAMVQPIIDIAVMSPMLKNSFYQDITNAEVAVIDVAFGIDKANEGEGKDCNVELIKRCRVVPTTYESYLLFDLPFSYIQAFREVVNYFLDEEEKDNFQLMEQAGAELTVDITNENFSELRAMLTTQFDIEPRTAIIDGEEVVL